MTFLMAKGIPARIMGATASQEGGRAKSGSRTIPWLIIIQPSIPQETHDASVVAKADP